MARSESKPDRRQRAITASLVHHTDQQVAEAAGISTTTLSRFKRDPEFQARLRAAGEAEYQQQMARVQEWSVPAAKSIRNIAVDSRVRPATRLKAALSIIRENEEARTCDQFAAALAEAEGIGAASRTDRKGHGAKFPRRQNKAILGCLTKRSIAEAAAFAGIGTQTLYRWMEDPKFVIALWEAAEAAFGQSTTILRQGLPDALTIVRNFSIDPDIPAATRLAASLYLRVTARKNHAKLLVRRLAVAEGADSDAGNRELSENPKVTGREVWQRLQSLKDRLLQSPWALENEPLFVHAAEGKPAGTSVMMPDGKHVWCEAPEGSQPGEPVAA